MKTIRLTRLIIMLSISGNTIFAQNSDEIKLKLDEEGKRYVKFTFLNQTWLRYNQSNPGTVVVKEPTAETFDIGLRRTRMQLFGQLTEHVFFYTQFGQNNFNFLSQNAGNRKLQAFFHDALAEYNVWKQNNHLKLGAGLTIANGLSRFSQPSVSSIMTMDVPVFAQATVDQTDEFSRKLSVYARGQVGKMDYRFVLSDPFPIINNGQTAPDIGEHASFAQYGHHKQLQGFLAFNFFDSEPHTTPYMTGTYLGKKKIFNLEAGFIAQKNATWTREAIASDTIYHSMNLWSVALFYDAPLRTGNGSALSAYAGYFDYDFGPGYLRYNGIMNPAGAGNFGNAFPMFGTGSVIYTQLGYLFKNDLLGEGRGTLMPYVSLMSADYERLRDRMNVFDIGVNWMIKGHNAKLTLDYQNRPVYELKADGLEKTSTKSQIVLQYQIFI
jgi:hypothetical protein